MWDVKGIGSFSRRIAKKIPGSSDTYLRRPESISRQIYITKKFALRCRDKVFSAFPGKRPGLSTRSGQENGQTACKPGSVRPKSGTTIPLGRPSRCVSRDHPGRRDRNVSAHVTS